MDGLKKILIGLVLVSGYSSYLYSGILNSFKEQWDSTSLITKGAIIAGTALFAYQWYQIRNLKKEIDKNKTVESYFREMMSTIFFGIDDYKKVRNYWRNNYSVLASRFRIRDMFTTELNAYNRGEMNVKFSAMKKDNAEFLDHKTDI